MVSRHRALEELTYPQIGEYLGTSPNACRMLYARAMAALTLAPKEEEMANPAPPG